MQLTTIEIETDTNEWHHLIPMADLHCDSVFFDDRKFKQVKEEITRLKNAHVILLGDNADFMIAKDAKRYNPSNVKPHIATSSDQVGEIIKEEIKLFSDLNIDLIVEGNHEHTMLNKHNIDVVEILASKLKTRHGGYCGILTYRMKRKGSRGSADFNVVYHHGNWLAKTSHGYTGAKDWFNAFDNFDVAIYGHLHEKLDLPKRRLRRTKNGEIVPREVHYIACGTGKDEYRQDKKTSFLERNGSHPKPTGWPVISWRLIRGEYSVNGKRIDTDAIQVVVHSDLQSGLLSD